MKRSGELPCDGILARATKPLAGQADRLELPVVNVWFSSPVRDRLPGVFSDFAAQGKLHAEHLLSRGLRRFALVTARGDRSKELVAKSFLSEIEKAKCQCLVAKIPLHFSATVAKWRSTEQALAEWMGQWELPIGVVVVPDDISRIAAQMCRGRGWRVPQDVAIVAGNNEETICGFARPTLTSIEADFQRVGYRAARLLDQLMDEKAKRRRRKRSKAEKPKAPTHLFLPPKGLIVRESTDFFTSDNPEIAQALAFIAAKSHRPIRVVDVANLETRTLRRRFQKHLGRPVVDEIRRVRIERAKRELAQGDLNLGEIASATGFLDSHRMYEVFVRELDITPSEYRKQRRAES
ncbi:MAG: substrate-binding domain-containing protein [Rubripirellula sp.]|nr:substrate-binding domain-containing protein [Rubripirellula sp.]